MGPVEKSRVCNRAFYSHHDNFSDVRMQVRIISYVGTKILIRGDCFKWNSNKLGVVSIKWVRLPGNCHYFAFVWVDGPFAVVAHSQVL